MKKYSILKDHNIILINFESLMVDIGVACLNDLHEYKLINDTFNPSSSDVQKIIYHNTIFHICEEIINNKHKYKKILIIPKQLDKSYEIYNYCDYDKFNRVLFGLLNKLQKKLPLMIFFTETGGDFLNFNNKSFWGLGEGKELIYKLEQLYNNFEKHTYTFEKIKKFTEEYKLNFFSKKYFNKIKTKQLLIL